MKALVVGAGPAGLLAAHALASKGHRVDIIDKDPAYLPDRIFSLQYLHDPCGLEADIRELRLNYKLEGEERALAVSENDGTYHATVSQFYNVKLGRDIFEPNSTRFLWRTPVKVWSLKDAYHVLYTKFKEHFITEAVTWASLLSYAARFDLVVTTVPLPLLLPEQIWPQRVGYIAMGWTPKVIDEDTCLYNIDLNVPWYRATNLDSGKATEFRAPASRGDQLWLQEWQCPQLQKLRKVAAGAQVPSGAPSNVLFTGRWGSWDHAKLTHHAYYDVLQAVA